jgi:hypothetical protein
MENNGKGIKQQIEDDMESSIPYDTSKIWISKKDWDFLINWEKERTGNIKEIITNLLSNEEK